MKKDTINVYVRHGVRYFWNFEEFTTTCITQRYLIFFFISSYYFLQVQYYL